MAQDLVYSERSTHVSHHVASDGDGGGDLPLVVVNQGDPEDAGKVSQSSALPGSDDYIPPSWPWAPRKCCGGRNQGNEEQMCSPSAHPGAASLARCGQGAWVLPQRLFQLAPCQSHVRYVLEIKPQLLFVACMPLLPCAPATQRSFCSSYTCSCLRAFASVTCSFTNVFDGASHLDVAGWSLSSWTLFKSLLHREAHFYICYLIQDLN